MKKVGIVTHYNNSRNYGGVLQAYALCKVLNDYGAHCEQIPYAYIGSSKETDRIGIAKFFDDTSKRVAYRILQKTFHQRLSVFKQFREEMIPHNSNTFTDDTLPKAADAYDVFVTGSDQVWNPRYYHPGYFLSFVPPTKKKVSYAASISAMSLSEDEKRIFQDSLADFSAISVREKSDTELIGNLVRPHVEWVLDPTLLLSGEEWNQIVPKKKVSEKYVFTYFLGEGKQERTIAKQYAQMHKLKLVSIPYVQGEFRWCDFGFGDIKMTAANPAEFISLIRDAECVFTDSFHAVAFSCIYQKTVFAFARQDHPGMSTRLSSIMAMFGLERFLCNKQAKMNLSYIENCGCAVYHTELFESLKEKSISFLKENVLR